MFPSRHTAISWLLPSLRSHINSSPKLDSISARRPINDYSSIKTTSIGEELAKMAMIGFAVLIFNNARSRTTQIPDKKIKRKFANWRFSACDLKL